MMLMLPKNLGKKFTNS